MQNEQLIMITSKEQFLKTDDIQCDLVRKIFQSYSSRFKSEDPLYNKYIELKRFHTARVCENILDIGSSLQMDREHLNFVEILAWLHDIGRFEQYRKYRTFDDSVSENHAILGLRVIEQEKILEGFSSEQKEILSSSILNHNTRSIPENEPSKIDFYSRILRDADKLDIWRISIEMNITYKLLDEVLSETYVVPNDFIQSFQNRQTIKMSQASTLYNNTLFKLSWIYDLNFKRSFELFNESNIGQKLLDKIPQSGDLNNIGHLIKDYVAEKCLSYSS
jgi:HD superfamily phosphodiesterase